MELQLERRLSNKRIYPAMTGAYPRDLYLDESPCFPTDMNAEEAIENYRTG